jgi:hypothetical protein
VQLGGAMKQLVVALVVAGCSSSSPDRGPTDYNDCSWRDPQLGPSTCFEDDQHPGESWCTCATEAATCTYYNFENGCSCACARIGAGLWWSCIPDEEFSNPCPIPPPDAGVVD